MTHVIFKRSSTGKLYLGMGVQPHLWIPDAAEAMTFETKEEAQHHVDEWTDYYGVKGFDYQLGIPRQGELVEHLLDSAGRYEATYNAGSDLVTIWDNQKGGTKVLSSQMDYELQEAIDLIENEEGEAGPISKDEILFLLNTVNGIEQTRDHAAHDLEKYGEVGITG